MRCRSVEQRYLVIGAAALLLAGDDFTDLAGNVLLAQEALGQRHVDFAVGPTLPDVVNKNAGALQDARIELLIAALVGAKRSDVSARRDPFILDERFACGRDRHHYIGAADDLLEISRSFYLETRIFWALRLDELVERGLRAAQMRTSFQAKTVSQVARVPSAMWPAPTMASRLEFLRASHLARPPLQRRCASLCGRSRRR